MLRPCIVAGPDAQMLVRQIPLAPGPLPTLLPDPGTPFQLVHHDDVASALVAATRGAGDARRVQPRRRGDDDARRPRPRARRPHVPGPAPLLDVAALGAGLPLVPTLAQWVNAGRVPVVMDTAKARRELRWRPRYDSRETLARARSRRSEE